MLLPSIFKSLIQDIHILTAFNDALHAEGTGTDQHYGAIQEFLQNYSAVAAAYSRNAIFLCDKIRSTTQLLSDTMYLKHDKIAQTISENTLALNNAAVKDSATIRVITVVTLLYLPATFVAVNILLSKVLHGKKTDTFRPYSECSLLEQTRQVDSRWPRYRCGSLLH